MSSSRTPRYLRVSLLSACNLRCSYCLPQKPRRRTTLAPDDKVRLAIAFLHSLGIRKIRFTGGEPTLYRDLGGLLAFVKSMGASVHTAITSNGVLLESQAPLLSAAGLDSANISLDTLDPEKFRAITGSDSLDRVIAGIDKSAELFANVKLNCVLMRGVNDDEVERLVSFADGRGLDMRFIEFMPNRYSVPGDQRFISSEDIRRRLPWDLHLSPGKPSSAARYYRAPTLGIRVGFISSVSRPFCDTCDRIRLTAQGHLHNCLYDSAYVDLFSLLRADPDRAIAAFNKLVWSKQFGGCHGAIRAADALPSFSAMGG